MKPEFEIVRTAGGDEGPHSFFVNGDRVGFCDHDTHGWDGMAEQIRMFKAIADVLGVEVLEVDE
jgi:hypothetical protein